MKIRYARCALFSLSLLLTCVVWLEGCALFVQRVTLTGDDLRIAERLKIKPESLAGLKAKPLYKFTEQEVDTYLRYLRAAEPDLRKRLMHLAHKNLGQPYRIFLLGEFPFELYDAQPLYYISESDCVVFSEHMYAMALAWDWRSFFAILQRIRYKNGEIGVLTRNHYTVPDWDANNDWLVYDISRDIAGDRALPMKDKTNRRAFFKKWNIGQDMEDKIVETFCVPGELIPSVVDQLREGDFVNVMFGKEGNYYAGHVGLISRNAEGKICFLHSTPPRVVEVPLVDYTEKRLKANVERKKKGSTPFVGYKFLRLREDPLGELRRRIGENAPLATCPVDILKAAGQHRTLPAP
jgi:hypothetical protein